jgi:hypothetical protein
VGVGLWVDGHRNDQRNRLTMLSIKSRAAITALVTLPALLGTASITDAARMTTDSIRTELAANPDRAPTESGIMGQVSIRPVRPHAIAVTYGGLAQDQHLKPENLFPPPARISDEVARQKGMTYGVTEISASRSSA